MKRRDDDHWKELGEKRRRCDIQETCGVCQYPPEEVKNTLLALAKFIIQRLTGYKVSGRSVGNKILLCVSDANEPEETLQSPVRIWLSYQKSRVCDEFRVTMKISFGWYSMVKEYVPGEPRGHWIEVHENGVRYSPPFIRCQTIFNRIECV